MLNNCFRVRVKEFSRSLWQTNDNNNSEATKGRARFENGCGSIEDDLIPTKSLKEAIKSRPSVSEFVKV